MSAIYFVLSPGTGHYKVGCSKDPHARLKELRRFSPGETIIGAILPIVTATQRQEMLAVERRFHERYLPFHHRGEWFFDNDLALADMLEINAGTFDLATLPTILTEASLLRPVHRGPHRPAPTSQDRAA